MLEGRRSIHQPMRDLIDGIMGLYTAADSEMTRAAYKTTSPQVQAVDRRLSYQQAAMQGNVESPREGKRARAERGELESPAPGPKKPKNSAEPKPKKEAKPQRNQATVPTNGSLRRDNKEDWTRVNRRKGKVKLPKPDAIVVKGSSKMSYAEMLRSVKSEPKLKSLAQHVKGIRKTAKGELLFELSKPSDPQTKRLQEAVQEFLGSEVEVRALTETSLV
ncbi:hypothetical protein KR018_002865, partial [Drosophila ironensis]